MNWKTLSVTVLAASLAGCATPERPSYQEIADSKEHLFIDRERVEYTPRDVSPDCDANGCLFSIEDANILLEDTERMQGVIESLNDEADSLQDAHNSLVRALIECEYGKSQRDATIEYQDKELFRERLIGIGKQIFLAGVCKLLLD